jgi:hypothetical protein
MFDFGLQNHFCYSIGNVQLALISQPDRRLSGGGYLSHLVRSSSRFTTYSVFRQLDPAFRRAALPAFMPSIFYRVVTTVINSSIFSNKCAACGDEGIRTPDLRRARAALSQLSYIPDVNVLTRCGPFRART